MWTIYALAAAAPVIVWAVIELGAYLILPRLRDSEIEL